MATYYAEVADDENWEKKHRLITFEADTPQEALKLANEKLEEDESIYQICTDVEGCSLPQPVWDFFNNVLVY